MVKFVEKRVHFLQLKQGWLFSHRRRKIANDGCYG